MASNDGVRKEDRVYKSRELEAMSDDSLQAKMAELIKTREELKRARDSAMQSWLDSRPVIDELEKLQSDLASAKNRTSMSNVVISELESQLRAANMNIKSNMEEELKCTKMTDEITRDLDQARNEQDALKQENEEGQGERSRLKQDLRIHRQTLRTLQLTLRAIRIESEAFGASAEEAVRHVNSSEAQNSVVQLTKEEYHALCRRAKEEEALAKWRISVSMEQKLAAEARRDMASSRLKALRSGNRSMRTEEERRSKEMHNIEEVEEQDTKVRAHEQGNKGTFPRARAKENAQAKPKKPPKRMRRSKSNKHKMLLKKKKPSILGQIKRFFVRSITRLFR